MTSAPVRLDTVERLALDAPPTARAHLPALTAARFIAAFQVLLFHCTSWSTWLPSPVRAFVSTGYIAVAFFFILSGFILTYTYWSPMRAGLRLGVFYKARFARIYPMYSAALLLAAPFYAKAVMHAHGGAARGIRDALLTVSLLQAHVPSAALSWNPPGWSLSTEAFFYLCFPFVLPVMLRGSMMRAWLTAVISVVVAVALPVCYLMVNPDGVGNPDFEAAATWVNLLRYHPLARLAEFLLGMCVARAYLDEPALRTRRAAMLLTGGSLAALAGLLAFADEIPYVLLHNGLLAPAFAALVLGLATTTPISKPLQHRWLVTLGEASYALYILHVPLFMGAGAMARKVVEDGDKNGWFTLVFILFAIATSVVAYRFIEVPARRYLLRR
jgi:peptidoglycan/LPS O-acetylase OafA/YrhL